jgi:[ribosomal protein S5]-alanine N-acetyltransferase
MNPYLLTGQETERLSFKLVTIDYYDEWLPLFREENVAAFLGMDTNFTPEECCKTWFEKSLMRYEKNLGGMNVVIDKQNGRLIGQCGLLIQEVEGKERLEIGYSMLPEFWGKGYASEAAIKCKEFAFDNNLADSLISIVHPDNIGSETVARKNGMQLEKYLADYKGMPVNIFRVDRVNK